jgi:hypothetical protein
MRPVQTVGILLVLAATIVVQLPDRRSQAAVMIEPIE